MIITNITLILNKAKGIQVYLRKKDHDMNDYDLYFFDKK